MCDKATAGTPEIQTVEQFFDKVIYNAKKTLEVLVIRKAKLETLGMLDMPHRELQNLLQSHVWEEDFA